MIYSYGDLEGNMVSRGKDDFEKIALLYEFYGELLSNKQKKFMELYYFDDLSLSEIADEYGISRQAVSDGIKHAKSSLLNYEEKLHLVSKTLVIERNVKKIDSLLSKIEETTISEQTKKEIKDIRNKLKELKD